MGILSHDSKTGQLVWQMDGETLVIEAWGENSLRVRSAMQANLFESGFALLPPGSAGGPEKTTPVVRVEEGTDHEGRKVYSGSIQNGNITAKVEENGWTRRCRLSFYNKDGKLLLRETGDGGALTLHARHFKPIIGGDWRLTASFESDPDEKLYGMGQYQQDILNIKNCNFELAHRNSQASVPFVLSSAGYGFFWHNPAVGRASFGKNRTEWVAESTKMLDYWVTAGDSPAEIEQAYLAVTGRPPMMPEYGLGFWQCKLRYWNQEQLLNVAREYHRRDLKVDVIVCDFFHWPYMGDYRFDEEFFPDPDGMVRELKEMGMELMVSVWPQIAYKSENFDEMRAKNLLVKNEHGINVDMRFQGDSVFYDATNPEARRYVWEKCKKNYYDKGIKVFWLDEAEPEYEGYDFENYRYQLGPNVQVGNIYPQMYSRGFYEGMEAEGQENIINLVRCAWAGSQRYGALVWSGDIHSSWQDFKNQVVAGLQMAVAGIPWWTTDIGGFHGGWIEKEDFRELLVRWFQYGAFCPVMRLHGDRKPAEEVTRVDGSPALFSGADNEVWTYGEENYAIMKKYIELREALRPYTRALMQEAHEKGNPPMRPVFYEFPQDEKAWELPDQFCYGPDLLVAPVVEAGARNREVYLPAGAKWTCLVDGKEYEGGQVVVADAPMESMPVFAKNGSHAELVGKL